MDRTIEFKSLLSSATVQPAAQDTVFQKLLKKVAGPKVLSEEDIMFVQEFAQISKGLAKAISSHDRNPLSLRQQIDTLENDLISDGDVNEQSFEHHQIVIITLKQRLSAFKIEVKPAKIMATAKPITHDQTTQSIFTVDDIAHEFDLSPQQLTMLTASTKHLLQEHSSISRELDSVSSHLTTISQLQQALSEQLEWQEAIGERLLDEAECTVGVVKKGNDILEKVGESDAIRNIVIAVFLVLSLLIILFHLLN